MGYRQHMPNEPTSAPPSTQATTPRRAQAPALQQALRDNLQRRKAQQRPDSPEADSTPES